MMRRIKKSLTGFVHDEFVERSPELSRRAWTKPMFPRRVRIAYHFPNTTPKSQ